MADEKRYQIIDGPLSIRDSANGNRTGASLSQGEEITVTGDATSAGGYLWVNHAKGWSALGTDDESEMYMLDITDRDPNAPRRFRVWTSVLSIRDGANGARLTEKLYRDTELDADPTSRTEAGGYIWWKHDIGWSAERNSTRSEIYLKEIFDTAETAPTTEVKETTVPVVEVKKTTIPDTWIGKKALQVSANSVKIRFKPSTDSRAGYLKTVARGEVFNCDMDTLTEADGYYWVRHDLGWSAIQSTDGKDVFLVEPGTIAGLIAIGADGPAAKDLPDYRNLFTHLPVEIPDIQWFQYFGNNMFAMRNGTSYGYDRYSQGLHGGLDFGNSLAPKPVYAALDAEFVKTEYPSANNTRMYFKKDDYIFIYQHITAPRQYNEGDIVPAGTQIATIEHHSINNGWDHLHFEVRFMKSWIVNPLLLFTENIYNQLIVLFNPDKPNTGYKKDFPKSVSNFFYHTDTWTKWITPLDQPMLKLQGEVIGPRGELDKSEW